MAFGQITILSLRQSHPELLELDQVRDSARERAKVVDVEVECLHVLHAKQLGRHLRQTHDLKLTTMCELSDMQIIDARDPFSVVLDAFLDDAIRRLAAKNYLRHSH
jgi:hypothetical protein